MNPERSVLDLLLVAALALIAGGCATAPPIAPDPALAARPDAGSVLRSLGSGPELEDRLLALNPERISEDDVRDTLAKGPAPHIMLLHGGIFPVHLMMVSAGRFLTGMGYPESKIRHPGDRRWSHSPYEDSAQLAGLCAWYYEHDGMRPMMIGHSQGGVQAIKVLYELAGTFDSPIPVWNPYTDASDDRTTIVDPLTGVLRPVVGLSVSYVSVVGAGGAAMLLPNQWSMAGKLRTIPDTVDEFTGFALGLDLWAWTLAGAAESTEFRHNGTAAVRNVILPAVYNHVFVPVVAPLAEDRAARDWIEAYVPDTATAAPPPETVGFGALWAADVWYSVKKHWALEAQRLIRAKRSALGQP
jgi:hypothetical protein